MLEIERKYVIYPIHEYNLKGYRSKRFVQGYLTTGDSEVRVRNATDSPFKLAVKRGSGLVRKELEAEITDPGMGRLLLALAEGRVVEKTRYNIGRWEVDQFHGALEGLWLAEVELENEDERTPPCPAIVRIKFEATGDRRYTNQHLAVHGIPGLIDG